MRNVEFKSKDIKEYYRALIKANPGLLAVIQSLLQENNVIVNDIIYGNYSVTLMILQDNEDISIEINLLNNKIYVSKPEKKYKEIYHNIEQKSIRPMGFEYRNINKSITKKNFIGLGDKDHKIYYYDLSDNDCNYNILIEDDQDTFNEEYFINKMLYPKNKYYGISNVVLTILSTFNLNNLTIKITDTKGSIAIIDKGYITKYLEYREIDNEIQKIYLEDDQFYVEKKKKEIYSGGINSYVKKIGEINGKEKR